MVISYSEKLELHYSKLWSPAAGRHKLNKGPVHELPPCFEILEFQRTKDMKAYATLCMSESTDPPDDRLELHLFAPPSGEAVCLTEVLTATAHYHRTGARLGLGHTVNFGQPWLPGSRCTFGLISLPYLDGPELERLAEPEVKFLWLIPVTEKEVAYKRKHGMEALEERFEEAQFNYLDPLRSSVV